MLVVCGWTAQPGGIQPHTGVRTFYHYAGAIPDAPTTAAGWNAAAPRAWVAWVRYPGLPEDPSHPLAKKYLPRGAGGMVVFGPRGGYDGAVRFNIEGAQRLVMSIPPGTYDNVLDVGCGTGFSTQAVIDRFHPSRVTGVDPSEGILWAPNGNSFLIVVGDEVVQIFIDRTFRTVVSSVPAVCPRWSAGP